MHGDDDSVVHIRASNKFVDSIKQYSPETTLRYDIAPGQDHAFDFNPANWTSFSAPALDFVAKGWLEG
jgi:hypothetical protein